MIIIYPLNWLLLSARCAHHTAIWAMRITMKEHESITCLWLRGNLRVKWYAFYSIHNRNRRVFHKPFSIQNVCAFPIGAKCVFSVNGIRLEIGMAELNFFFFFIIMIQLEQMVQLHNGKLSGHFRSICFRNSIFCLFTFRIVIWKRWKLNAIVNIEYRVSHAFSSSIFISNFSFSVIFFLLSFAPSHQILANWPKQLRERKNHNHRQPFYSCCQVERCHENIALVSMFNESSSLSTSRHLI